MPDAGTAFSPQVDRTFLWKVSFIAGLGGILYGFDVGVIDAALDFVRSSFHLTPGMEGAVVSVVAIGSMLGALWGGTISDRLGRRPILAYGGALFIAGSILAAFSPNALALILARALLGLAIGFTSVTAPVYVSELAPPSSRGMLIGLYQFALTLGISLADLAGYWLAGAHAWRWMFAIGALPAFIFLMLVMILPESPRWLVAQGQIGMAKRVLCSYTGSGANSHCSRMSALK